MIFKRILVVIFVLTAIPNGFVSVIYCQNDDSAIEEKINDLLGQMTLEEKVMQMNQRVYGTNANPNNIDLLEKEVEPEIGSLLYRSTSPIYRNQIQRKAVEDTRLGIPIIFGFDIIHGYRTIFPIPLAQACSWNTSLVQKASAIAAKESWLSGLDWTFSPMIDVARDPRWGRVSEGYGEDPYVNSEFCVATVNGYQGEKLSDKFTIAACLKHYVGYSLSEGGRDYVYSDVSSQTLWETFLPPYEAGIKAGAATVMSGFNDLSGIPVTANYYTLTEILKNRWKHDGFVISDWGSIRNLVDQGVAKDRKEAGYKAIMAGVEMDMVDDVYVENLPALVEEGKVPMEVIDEAVRRILRVKFQLGLFDQPYVDVVEETDRYLRPEYIAVAKNLAAESMVLLKNENDVLPIKPGMKNIAMIGPMLKDSVHIMGSWDGMGRSNDTESLYEGMLNEFGKIANLRYELGCDFDGNDTSGFKQAREISKNSDIVLLFLGEKKNWSGENASRASIALPEIQEQLVEILHKTGKPVVLILSSGRPLELIRLNKMADAIIEIWQPGTAGGSALAEILSGKINPSGKLAITFPQTTGQIPMHYNQRKSARPGIGHYQDIPVGPLFGFGHGLSYTDFDYGEITLSKEKIKKDEQLIAEITVGNNGSYDGKEAVLWFVADPIASISRPAKELKFFEKKQIQKGEEMIYKFVIEPMRDLSYVDGDGKRYLEAGDFYLEVGDKKVHFELID
ncbi:MAG: glycoside hydrolase family 3 C-terminal domain-containing protein [Melioribacteraceae bacterium]|nr:glycoside hydrolase family 3 C-terminal domain-containing protein [Melioribacteraceae bacterium]MCF8266329.1 glycoside hydrolase family 3 C-terminal domain-containing protein [Melioribacteraceae bacterium]